MSIVQKLVAFLHAVLAIVDKGCRLALRITCKLNNQYP